MEHQTRQPTYALVYLLGMSVATVCGTGFVVGGMLAGARGLTAVALAAIIPIAGLLWAIVLSTIDRGRPQIRRAVELRAVQDGMIDRSTTGQRSSRPSGHGSTPSEPLVGPGQNHR